MYDSKTRFVGSGSYHIGKTQPMLLQAILGTCVGVTLCDSNAGVGGMLHLLLPEPRSSGTTFQPEKYASNGLPLFIKDIYEAGASRENLKACIAGGALVGPIMEQDLVLDIGGRTADVVKKIFAEEGIKVEASETGGFFTCCLSLNMDTWETIVEPSGNKKLFSVQSVFVPTLEQINHAIEQLQPIPQVALKILRMIDDDTYDVKKIADEVRNDQVITARTIQLCNSAMFARNKIDNLDHALVFLGQNIFIKLIISAALQRLFNVNSMGYSLCKGGLYHHAVGTAMVAEKLAEFSEKIKPSLAYIGGLLHDIGKVVLDQYISSAYPLFYRRLQEKGQDFPAIEKKILGIDHTGIGSELAKKWAFPEVLIDTIKNHHNPEKSSLNPELVNIVNLADLLMSRFHPGLELERLDTNLFIERLESIGLSTSQFPEIVELIPGDVFDS